jgi:putative salt-induced outer membrane protein YdiY
MLKNFTKMIICMITGLLMLSISNAQEKAVTEEKKDPYAGWWIKSSLSYDPLPQQFLFHGEGQYAYTSLSGNATGEIHSGKAIIKVRKAKFTNHFGFQYDKLDQKGDLVGNYFKENLNLEDMIDFDITEIFYAEIGGFWQKDNIRKIKNRYIYYGGVGLATQIEKSHNLKGIIALASVDQKYDLPDNILAFYDVVREPFQALYLNQNYTWRVNEGISLSEDFKYIVNLKESKRYQYNINLQANIFFSAHFGIFWAYSYQWDNDAPNTTTPQILISMGAPKIVVSAKDARNTIGFFFSF